MGWLTLVGAAILIALVVVLLRSFRGDKVGAIEKRRQATSKLVSRALYVEGAEKIPVVLSLGENDLYYENPDLEASFELSRLDEIEYADDLATGKSIGKGCRVLRLRSHGALFEFILEPADCGKWMAALRPHRFDDVPTASAPSVATV